HQVTPLAYVIHSHTKNSTTRVGADYEAPIVDARVNHHLPIAGFRPDHSVVAQAWRAKTKNDQQKRGSQEVHGPPSKRMPHSQACGKFYTKLTLFFPVRGESEARLPRPCCKSARFKAASHNLWCWCGRRDNCLSSPN